MSVTLVSVYFSMYTLYFECKCSFCVMWTNPCLKFSLRQTTSLSLFCPCPKTGLRSTSWRHRRCSIRERECRTKTMLMHLHLVTFSLFHPAVSPLLLQVATSNHTVCRSHEGQTPQEGHASTSVWVSLLMLQTLSLVLLFECACCCCFFGCCFLIHCLQCKCVSVRSRMLLISSTMGCLNWAKMRRRVKVSVLQVSICVCQYQKYWWID